MNRLRLGLSVALLGVLAVLISPLAQIGSPLSPNAANAAEEKQKANPGEQTVKDADQLFLKKNYADAAKKYDAHLKTDKPAVGEASFHRAYTQLIASYLRLSLFDDALDAADRYVKATGGTHHEARARHMAGNLWMSVPHWGTRSGGKFHRAQYKQGIRLRSEKHDKAKAVNHLEAARELYAKYDADKGAEKIDGDTRNADEVKQWREWRIKCLFDLAGVCSRFGIYENSWQYWYGYWGSRDDFMAQTAGEDDFDEYYTDWQLRRKRPIGLRIDKEGNPIFPSKPGKYAGNLKDDQKILYLLDEVRGLDQTDNKIHTATSFYRQAMLARARFGTDRLNQYAGMYYSGGQYPIKKELEAINPWEMKDNETILLAGGRVIKATLPKQFDIFSLLRTVAGDYKQSGIAGEAQYAIGLHYQSRQQYTDAIDEFETVIKAFPQAAAAPEIEEQFKALQDQVAKADGDLRKALQIRLNRVINIRNQQLNQYNWAQHAKGQIDKIKAPQLRISQNGVQLPDGRSGAPTELQLSYRNVNKVYFVARRVNHIGFMEEIRAMPAGKQLHSYFYGLRSWHSYFVNGYYPRHRNVLQQLAAKHIGKEVARWESEVKDDGSHRYATATLPTPLKDRGAYLVFAYHTKPPESHAQLSGAEVMNVGNSRSIMAMTDVSIVEKKSKDGNVYWMTDAVTGSPLNNTKVDILEVWTTYDRPNRKTVYHKRMHNLVTDAQGLVTLAREQRRYSQLHVLSTTRNPQAQGQNTRHAWSGMSYWGYYNPSRMRQGTFAFVITDRPVYRPEQDVKYKLWVRHKRDGLFENRPSQHVTVTVYDPRGNKVHSGSATTDQYGGIDGSFKLGSEPTLGLYRLQVHGQNYVGGQNFRVEEYKKPEFEVSVEPDASHKKLGEKVTAVIKAKYYFGGAVTNANVKYKVFREEYRHSYFTPGYWDWLYGPGYGYAWYSGEHYPWWGKVRSCFSPPGWWWGYYGQQNKPVRELVKQGEGQIGKDGTLKVEIDTTMAKRLHGDQDHRYVVVAEVRDSSRRTITGEGSVKVTRQAYYTFVQADGGYYKPGDEMVVRVRSLTPGNKPVQTRGVMTISSVVFGGPNNAKIKETELKRFAAQTDEDGNLRLQFRWEKSGLLKFHFRSPDEWGNQVDGIGMVWVVGDDFKGKFYRFNNLELITDKRTYEPGETANVMINTKHPNSYVLFADEVDSNHLISYRLLHLPEKSTVVQVPIKQGQAPNFFLEATTVADTRVHSQVKRILVPPADGVVNLAIKTDKASYQPGETAKVNVTATGIDGKPAQTQINLSAFDKSVLYIQSEYTPKIEKFFHGHVRSHRIQMTTNLTEQFAAQGYVHRPFQQLYPYPHAWWGVWSPTLGDHRVATGRRLRQMAGGDAGGFGNKNGDFGDEEMADAGGLAADSVATNGRGGARREMAAKSAAPGAPMAAGEAQMSNRANSLGEDKKRKSDQQAGQAGGGGPDDGGGLVEAEMRKNFADTALWQTTLTTNAQGHAQASFTVPDNLTTWKLNAYGITKKTRVGQASTEVISTKNLLVRLQAPRFFMEHDEVVVSAIVNNYLSEAKMATISLKYPDKLMTLMDPSGNNSPQEVKAMVPAGGEKRIDWRIKVKQEGYARLAVTALTDEESDAMQMGFPVLVHGVTKQVGSSGIIKADDTSKSVTITLNVPHERKPELTRLEVQYAPSLVGAMLDALPYTLYYPYGCTEQTMSRFLPAVLTRKTLQNMGISLEDTAKIRGRMEEIRRVEKGEKISIYSHIDNPVFDTDEMDRIINKGLARITSMQNGDGGWGWWKGNQSSGYLTSYVLYALINAQRADVKVEGNIVQRGTNFLRSWAIQQMREKHWAPHAQHAYVAYVLSLNQTRATFKPQKNDDRPGDLVERLWQQRDKLNVYGKSLLSLTLANLNDTKRANTVLDNVLQYAEKNEETKVAWIRTPDTGWWYWWNNDIETNAWALRAITKLRPKDPLAPRMVKWLLNNRKNGYYWRSTRDTTLCVHALSDYAVASGETAADYTLTLDLDNGKTVKKIKINKDNFFTYDNRFVVEGLALGGGKHTLKITKEGDGALYFNTYLRYFTKEVPIKAAGHELKVQREYYRLEQIPYKVKVETASGAEVMEERLRYKKVPVKDGDLVKIGQTVMVELKIKSDNNYTYLAFEDMKPAGFEPTLVKSGGKGQEGFASYMELRDEKVVFFVSSIDQGEHLLRYRLRAEVPGKFHALPTTVYAMYVPELRANSDERIIVVED